MLPGVEDVIIPDIKHGRGFGRVEIGIVLSISIRVVRDYIILSIVNIMLLVQEVLDSWALSCLSSQPGSLVHHHGAPKDVLMLVRTFVCHKTGLPSVLAGESWKIVTQH